MSQKELNVSSIVGELVKNSLDAQCTVVQVEFNSSFDFRVIDDGCGFDEKTMQDIGERQLLQSPSLQKTRFRYGKHGKFLFKIARSAANAIFVESIRQNCDVRLYKSIFANQSAYKIDKTDRSAKDALVTTVQGSMVVVNTMNLNIADAARLKSNIVNTVVDLSLINFEVDISVKDIAAQQTLYASYRTNNLFDKFEQFLESSKFFSKIQSVTCQKDDVKVEILLCEDGTSSKAFQFVYFNKLIEHDGKWRKFVNKLCKNRFENDPNSMCSVYLVNIFAEKYSDNQLAYNVVIDNCIRKCVEQLSQPAANRTSVAQHSVAETPVLNNDIVISSKEPPPKINDDVGVRLGDYIFNNSSANYKKPDIARINKKDYRNKICDNWAITLDPPKPKDLAVNDSLQNAVINRRTTHQQDRHLFKKPKPRSVTSKRNNEKIVTKMKPSPQSSSDIYKPSQHVRGFNDSSLLRASKELIASTVVNALKGKETAKKRNENRIESTEPVSEIEIHHNKKPSTTDLSLLPMDALPNDPFEHLNHQNDKSNHELSDAFKAPISVATQKTVDFVWNQEATNFNMNFSSSVAIHTVSIDDPFMNLIGSDVGDNSVRNSFQRIEQPASDVPIKPQLQTETNCTRIQLQTETNRTKTQQLIETNRTRTQLQTEMIPTRTHQQQTETNHMRTQRLTEIKPTRTQQQTETNRTRTQLQIETNRTRTQLQTETNRTRTQAPYEINRSRESSVYSRTSEPRYRHHRNNSVRTNYRQRTCGSNASDESLQFDRSGSRYSGVSKSTRSKSIKSAQSSTQTRTNVAPLRKPNSQLDLLNDNAMKAGWPVTININFGGQPQ